MSLAERVEAYIRDNDLDIALEYGAFPDRPYDSPGVWGDADEDPPYPGHRRRHGGVRP